MPTTRPVLMLRRLCVTVVTTAVLAVAGTATAATAVIPGPGPGSPALPACGTCGTTSDPAGVRVLVNKSHPLTPRDWRPEKLVRPDVAALASNDRLRPVAARALERLSVASRRATGKELVLVSGFRSADYQRDLYRRYVEQHGRPEADTFSARAGYSEHQTGLAADVTEDGTPFTRFGGTVTSRWVEAEAWRFGFVVRYPRGERAVTGYAAEPWHLRYVGVGLATHMHRAGITTLEEASGTGPAPTYPPR